VPINSESSRLISPMLHLHFWNDQNRSNICDSEESCLPLAANPPKYRPRYNQDNCGEQYD
jgi:hypothetical protein